MNLLRLSLVLSCLLAWPPTRTHGQAGDATDLGESLRELVGEGLIEEHFPIDDTAQPPASSAGMPGFREQGSRVTWGGYLQPAVVQPGTTATLVVTAVPEAEYHVYPYSDTDDSQLSKPTLIVVTDGFTTRRPRTNAEIKHEAQEETDDAAIPYHPSNVTWAIDVIVPKDRSVGEHRIAGIIGYQTCTDGSCLRPQGAEFEADVMVGPGLQTGRVPLEFRASSYFMASAAANERQANGDWPPSDAGAPPAPSPPGQQSVASDAPKAIATIATTSPATEETDHSVAYVLLSAFLGGLILNVMPCVLPVIGLKLMAFVQQAGESRWRVFELNLWYSLGLMTVFMVLAALAVLVGLSWGAQFSSTVFSLVVLSVVFVFGLALLGVWEVPIPGFIGSGAAVDAAAREGRIGAYFKGTLTTILAVPCTGPFLGPALTWAVKQSPALTYSTFAMVGLGMASPYLLVGAFPKLIAFLPKPGAWMNTFKHLMGFVLMGTAVFIFSFLNEDYIIKALALLVSLGFACFWIGQNPFGASWITKARSWAEGALVVAVTIAGMFFVLPMLSVYELAWEPFTRATLDQHLAQGNTVLVDFTADW